MLRVGESRVTMLPGFYPPARPEDTHRAALLPCGEKRREYAGMEDEGDKSRHWM